MIRSPAAADPQAATRRLRLVLAGSAWAGLIVSWIVYQRRSGMAAVDTAQPLIDAARGNWWAIAAYLAVSLVRPLVLFPATIATIAAGVLFGPIFGVLAAALAANASAMIGYSIARNLRRPGDGSAVTSRLGTWTSELRSNSFEAVLLTRLLFLPYDIVNYGCGLLHVRRAAFISATAIPRPSVIGAEW